MVVLKLPETSPFLTKLPPEIRLMIYEYALPSYEPMLHTRSSSGVEYPRLWLKRHKFSVLDVCQTFRNESAKIYRQHLKAEIACAMAAWYELRRQARLSVQSAFNNWSEILERGYRFSRLNAHMRSLNEELDELRSMGYTD